MGAIVWISGGRPNTVVSRSSMMRAKTLKGRLRYSGKGPCATCGPVYTR